MQFNNLSLAVVLAVTTAGFASAQNDECATAVLLTSGVGVPFDTTLATLSLPAWPCAAAAAPDLWYRYVATSNNTIIFSTCGSAYDTALEVFSGTCASLTSLVCNDDACALQSSLSVPGTTGATYYVRVGGYVTSAGTGTIVATEQLPPPANCVETTYGNNNVGNIGGALYFDLTVTQNVTISGMNTHFDAAAGNPVGIQVYTVASTYQGNEANQAAWTSAAMDNGAALSGGVGVPTSITFASPLVLSPGTYGIALVASGSAHLYTNGTGTNQSYMSGNGVLALSLGAASNFPFLAPTFTPRVWNGRFCTSGPVSPGTNYCTANPNSTGQPGLISGTGSAVVAMNNLGLTASQLPNNAFGYFITSLTQAVTPNPGGSLGILCVGGAIGRYTGPGQIKNTGLTGAFSLQLDLNQIPTPVGFVSAVVGQTRNFQTWHRDSVGGLAVSNFTNGLAVTFQ